MANIVNSGNIDYERFAGFIRGFAKQFEFQPKIENADKLAKHESFIVCGMGGSALGADLIRAAYFETKIKIWRDYGLPAAVLPKEGAQTTLVIASSYSGNTEESIDAYLEARKRGLPVAAITTGGKLLELAKKEDVPYILLPTTDIQPRIATGYSIKALLTLMEDEAKLRDVAKLAETLDMFAAEKAGADLAEKLNEHIPVIYASTKNFPIAYNWKIKFNETGKIPAFVHAVPELNHNEMTSFDIGKINQTLSKSFFFIFLEDPADDPRNSSRLRICRNLYDARGFKTHVVNLVGTNVFHRIFSSLITADWAAFYLAKHYGVDPEQVPLVEEFKRLIGKQ